MKLRPRRKGSRGKFENLIASRPMVAYHAHESGVSFVCVVQPVVHASQAESQRSVQKFVMNTMKVLLQHKTSLQFFKGNFDWTFSSEEAMNFGTSLRAMDFCQCHNLPEIQVILN